MNDNLGIIAGGCEYRFIHFMGECMAIAAQYAIHKRRYCLRNTRRFFIIFFRILEKI